MVPHKPLPRPALGYSLLGASLLLLAVCYSVGYHAEDEHHQTIGLALARAGELGPGEIVWEYAARIRSSALPWVATGMLQASEAIGITDPFVRTSLLRLLTAALAWLATYRFLRATLHRLPEQLHGAYQLISWSLWFLPFLHVRFAAETGSALWLLLGAASLLGPLPRVRTLAWGGACLALAIWVRPPVAVAVLGIVGWWCFAHQPTTKRLLPLMIGALLVLGLSVVADSLFYGTPTCSIVRYTVMGVLGDPAHDFGRMPWWYYLPWIGKYAVPPIGASILLAFGLLLWKDRSHPLVWMITPFLLLHMLVPHKELRFLYPMAPLMPLLLVEAYRHCGFLQLRPRSSRVLIALLITCNVAALTVATLTPAGNGRVAIAQWLQQQGHADATLTYGARQDVWRIEIPRFYRPAATPPSASNTAAFILSDRVEVPSAADPRWVASGQPAWSLPLLDLYDPRSRSGPLRLYRLEDDRLEPANHR